MRRGLLVLGLVLMLALPPVRAESVLRFTNSTECGTATISLVHTPSGQTTTHTVAQGESITIEVIPDALYRYEVTYPRDPATNLQCEAKSIETRVQRPAPQRDAGKRAAGRRLKLASTLPGERLLRLNGARRVQQSVLGLAHD